jgi:putative FmdB family regulatory protein
MPIYEYRCSTCGFQKEYLQKVSDPILTRCPECGKETFSKLLSAAGFQLKGSGWYATDFKNSGTKPAAKTESKDKSDSKDKTESKDKSDKKSDTKSEAVSCGSGACPSCS